MAAGTGTIAATAFGLWGRFALGDEFEQHVARQIGLAEDLTAELLARMREEVENYELRAAGFTVATSGPSSQLLPRDVRAEAIESFLGPLWGLSRGMVLPPVMAGLRKTSDYVPCRVLVT